jgi:signal transduction histidine kinase
MTDPTPDFRLLFEHSPDILLILLPDAPRYTMVAATKARFAATHTTADTIGRGLFELFPDNPDDPAADGTAKLRSSLERVLATRAADTMAVQKYDIRGPDGTFEAKYWSPKNLPVLSPSGEVLYIIHRVEDVTALVRSSELGEELRDRTRQMEREVVARSRELSKANEELRAANARLGELDAAKTTFFNNVSHEFRTPLTLMLGPLQASLTDPGEPLGPRQRERVELALANAIRLLKLVNTLLDFARLEAGRLHATFAPLDASKLCAELAGMFQSAVDAARIKLVIDCPPLREPVWIDRDMWEKIVPNLISNAFKFTMAGEIGVRTREEKDLFVLEVSDTGIGIPEAELPRIFDRFHRVPGAAGRSHEGTGIGLALVRELVELHGGSVTVESTVGRGTLFRVSIPRGFAHLPADAVRHTAVDPGTSPVASAYAAEAARWSATSKASKSPAPSAGADSPGRRRRHVLVVDDNVDLRGYVSGLLAGYYEVTTAADGVEALEAVKKRVPDIVVSDVMMPRLDGLGLVRELRADPRSASLPIILLSARAGEDSAIVGLDVGADDYLMKPFSAPELLARVRTHVELAGVRRDLITELERANSELDAFSYSVSHDLRAPLRAISGFAQILVEDYSAALDREGKAHVERIRDGAHRMSALVADLLSLSRITRASVSSESVDLSELAATVVADLRRDQPTRAVDVEIEAGMIVRGDRALLRIVLVNLVGNAWKYTSRRASPKIEFRRAPGADETFFVRDNGAGFDMAHAGALFTPFRRLHRENEFEGTGIGLATVHRIVARHHGRVWAEAEVDRGATLFFSLPGVEG